VEETNTEALLKTHNCLADGRRRKSEVSAGRDVASCFGRMHKRTEGPEMIHGSRIAEFISVVIGTQTVFSRVLEAVLSA